MAGQLTVADMIRQLDTPGAMPGDPDGIDTRTVREVYDAGLLDAADVLSLYAAHCQLPASYQAGQRLTAGQLIALNGFPVGARPVAGTVRGVYRFRVGRDMVPATALVVTLDAGSGMANNETSVVVG